MIRQKEESKGIVIDLTGPQGNAFVLLGMAKNFCEQLQMTENNTNKVLDDMRSSDYENLIQVFDYNFGSFVTLLR